MSESTEPPAAPPEVPKSGGVGDNFKLGTYIYVKPRCWKNNISGKKFKVLPWFTPLEDRSQFDFAGLMKDIEPTLFTDDVLRDFEVYKGLVMRAGWIIENENGVWFGLVNNKEVENSFEDLGWWVDQNPPPTPEEMGTPLEVGLTEDKPKPGADEEG